MIDKWQLAFRKNMPLNLKVKYTQRRIKNWYEYFNGNVYVSFSGGKDSTVLLHLVRALYPDVLGVFADTGLEFPEIRDFVKKQHNIEWVKPKKRFPQVIKEYGYPVISKENAQKIDEIRNSKSLVLVHKRLYGDLKGNGKLSEKWKYLIKADFKISHKCCYYLKKQPLYNFESLTNLKPIVGTMASESALRNTTYLKNGCNAFNTKRPISQPLSFWDESDIWFYIKVFGLEYSSIYDKGYSRTGCMFCMFGEHMEKGTNKFQKMLWSHPKIWRYCMDKLGMAHVLDTIGVPYK